MGMKPIYIVFVLVLMLMTSVQSQAQEKNKSEISTATHLIDGTVIYGKPTDNQTRCVHYHSALDIIAIRFKCCDKYYPCFSCHEETAGHPARVWPKVEFDTKAVICGVCAHELTVNEYMQCRNTCPKCNSSFNPGCSKHYHLYFETAEVPAKK
jgi:uncharacterized CHY-type Zn-finger protein